MDFEEVISRKRHIIQSHNLGHENHVMISADLEVCDFSTRTLPLIQASLSKQDGFRTAVLAECCLMYLSEGAFREVLSCLADKLPASATLIIFDPLFLGDSFGRTMCLNLQVLYPLINNCVVMLFIRSVVCAPKPSKSTLMKRHTGKGCPNVDGKLNLSKV